ncbi:serine protease easter-like [Anopheles ziemanni]|uniref:serine protease easter-like n=1 Tax=Anopheles coustani TaxID=139045 RepID=UPI00265839F4|nr:serine protease easter-like [Anopheles coustani]XP_058178354.1 serine protease easter-like [Anopheles ziemanni]
MGVRQVLTALLSITYGCAVISQLDPTCLTPAMENGFCVPIERCRNIYNALNGGNLTRSNWVYITKATCKYLSTKRSVCCQPVEILPSFTTSATTTTTTTTTTTKPTTEALRIDHAALNRKLFPADICGTVSFDKIHNGHATSPFEFPWMVVLRYKTDAGLVDQCGGTLINDRYILTAAHCVNTKHKYELSKVRLGEHNKTTATDCIVYISGETLCAEAFDVDIEKMIIHKDYNRPTKFLHDIALIRMAEKINFTDSIKPICLPVDESVRQAHVPKYEIAGWGTTEANYASQVLLKATVEPEPTETCVMKMEQIYKTNVQISDSWQMCALGNNTDSCAGDSGGPLGSIVSVNDAPKFVQFGIISAGLNVCGHVSSPGIYTRVTSYMDWILANVEP